MPSLVEKAVKSYYQIKYAMFLEQKLAQTKFGAAGPKATSSIKNPTTIKNQGMHPEFEHRMPHAPFRGGPSTNLAAMQSPPPTPSSEVSATIKTKSLQPSLPDPVKPSGGS